MDNELNECVEGFDQSPVITSVVAKEDATQMREDLGNILENYLFELNTSDTHDKIEQNIRSYFSSTWEYPVTHLSVGALDEHGVGVALVVGDVSISADITEQYNIDEYNIDFTIREEDLANFGSFLREWTDAVAPVADPVIESADDILYSAIKNT
jgi:hypothetical protein